MAPKKRAPNVELSRLRVLAASGGTPFVEHALDLLASGDRMSREAALSALVERPDANARDALRALYVELDADGLKRDQGARMRTDIVRILRAIHDVRDADVAVRATDTREVAFGQDISWQLRAHGLMLFAEIASEFFPYYAIEHIDDTEGDDGEPAATAFSLLAATENYVPVYQWLLADDERPPAQVAAIFELFTSAPPAIVQRYAGRALDVAMRRQQEQLCTVLAESIVKLELDASYHALAALMSGKISDELYAYLAMLLAATNRPALLAILEGQLQRGRRSRLIVDALCVRTTPEQEAILDRWGQRD